MRSKEAVKSEVVDGVQAAIPGYAGDMIAGGGVRILTTDKLECLHFLQGEAVPQAEAVVAPQRLVKSTAEPVVVDVLGSVRVQLVP